MRRLVVAGLVLLFFGSTAWASPKKVATHMDLSYSGTAYEVALEGTNRCAVDRLVTIFEDTGLDFGIVGRKRTDGDGALSLTYDAENGHHIAVAHREKRGQVVCLETTDLILLS